MLVEVPCIKLAGLSVMSDMLHMKSEDIISNITSEEGVFSSNYCYNL